MMQNERDFRDQFKERVLPLLSALVRTARISAGGDEAGDRALEETISNAYREYAGDLTDQEFRLWIFGRLVGALELQGPVSVSRHHSTAHREPEDTVSRAQRRAEDPETLRSLRMRVKVDLNAGDVHQVTQTLPVNVRTALALALGGGLTPDEIAPVLEVSASAARASVNEGRRLLRQGLCDILHARPAGVIPSRQSNPAGPTLWRS